MRIILSKDRAAQLHLLIESLERFTPSEETAVVWTASGEDFETAYYMIPRDHWLDFYREHDFEGDVRHLLEGAGELTTFLCDDDVVFDGFDNHVPAWMDYQDILTFSYRLGRNTTEQYPTMLTQEVPEIAWDWRMAQGDFGYPGSVDGHVFRTADIQRMLKDRSFPNPTALECALVEGCHELARERPLMACYPHSVLVGNPVNRVSEQSNVRHGSNPDYSAEALNSRYLAGMRLDLDRIDFSKVDGAHTELELSWRPAQVRV